MDRLKNAVMVADTRPLLVAHILLQLQEDNKGLFDEAIIYHTNFSENDKKLMNSIMPCRFIDYISPIPKETFNLPRFKRFSPIMFVRYEIFNLIREYETIMWIDTDVLIQGDLSKLLEEVKKTGYAMLSEDPHNNSAGNVDYMRTNFFKSVPNYDMDRYLLCTGTIIVNRKLTIKSDYTNWCYKKTIEWAKNLNLPDQGVINALVQEFNIKTTPIGHNGVYGCFPSYGRDCSKAIYIHAWGENKFWNDWYLYNKFPKWKEVYDKWIDMGGSRLLDKFVPEVSIVIPTYKPDFGYFKQCLDSLIGQKKNDYERFSNFEIIIISEPLDQENITKFVESYDDNRIQLYFNESRLGIAASLNRGMRLSQGEFIARIDDDDIASPKRIFSQLSYLKENKDITLCTTEYNYFGDMNEGRKVFEGEMSKAWSIFTCPFDHPTIMFRKDFFINNNLFYDENRRFVEDWELWLRAFDKGMKVGCIHEVLMYHRWHNGSAGQSNKTVDMMDELVEQNFLKLDIKIPKDIIQIIRPWNGKVSEENYFKLENIFDTAIRNNYDFKIYDDKSLLHVFSIRLFEAKTGTLPEVNVELKENCIDFGRDNTENTVKGHFFKKSFKKNFKTFICTY
ncbi:hypothetical protein HMPREF9629_01838 [Peptoanaerobacter stomatis]|uniref:Glycosyltransferase 2-like domain-containing protein n=1 Tax=Peptoanaerobacter stomatis TaxID=796937 RepID=G9X0A2_9FIRM|nr:glycosyltransferase [Peptoanaerobacter stomatis]EHL15449.1 hypothetical protein HMPREF9629_01838 [Peptoanaerobacter stomatis]